MATLHCLTGCAIGEALGMSPGTALGWGNAATIALAVTLAFLFGYSLTMLPLLRAGFLLGYRTAARVRLGQPLDRRDGSPADNGIMLAVPGAMDAGLANPLFWARARLRPSGRICIRLPTEPPHPRARAGTRLSLTPTTDPARRGTTRTTSQGSPLGVRGHRPRGNRGHPRRHRRCRRFAQGGDEHGPTPTAPTRARVDRTARQMPSDLRASWPPLDRDTGDSVVRLLFARSQWTWAVRLNLADQAVGEAASG